MIELRLSDPPQQLYETALFHMRDVLRIAYDLGQRHQREGRPIKPGRVQEAIKDAVDHIQPLVLTIINGAVLSVQHPRRRAGHRNRYALWFELMDRSYRAGYDGDPFLTTRDQYGPPPRSMKADYDRIRRALRKALDERRETTRPRERWQPKPEGN